MSRKSPSRPIRTSPVTCPKATTSQPPRFLTTPKRTLWQPRSVGGPHAGAEADAGSPGGPERPVASAQGRFGAVQDLAVPRADRTGLCRAPQRAGRGSGLDGAGAQTPALADSGRPSTAPTVPAGRPGRGDPGRLFRPGLRL